MRLKPPEAPNDTTPQLRRDFLAILWSKFLLKARPASRAGPFTVMLHSPDNVCPLPTGLWQASPESSTFPYCHLSLYPHINKLWTTNGHCTETSKYWLQWNFANYFGPLFFMSFLLPSHCPAQSQGTAAVWAITWWLVILHLGSSLLKLWKISTTFFPSLDIAKPWPLSTAWHSSAMRLLTSLMSHNS